ncbi:phosphotransferase family protein [Rhodovulum kholense]|uniref:Phosphotransferase family enzyme n=1 Tax=Rhodovulum kholense TaxID=453584 RepID=A0A8E2VHY5_9RHOB|nr:phosphotransferase [Rhodovulum kholense]PTW46626.1 phosphotransferase family enzyme [Rhodovulum kholense]
MTGALVTDEMMAAACAAAGLARDGMRPGPAPLASPSYLALESASVLTGGVFLKVMHPEMREGFDLDAAMALARQAGEAGVGPRVLWSDAAQGAIAMEALTEADGWHRAMQKDLQEPPVLAAAMAALKALHATPALATRFDPFAQIDAQIAEFGRIGAPLPDDIDWLRRLIGAAEPVLRTGATLAPCRNDGSASNLMLGPGGAVRLVDYDRAGMNDPLYDLGVLLAEATDFERDMRAGFAAYAGGVDDAGFARARLWSFVDDMLHALWARLKARTSVRGGVEWLKYGEWRLMRLRMALNHPQFEQKIRLAGGAA